MPTVCSGPEGDGGHHVPKRSVVHALGKPVARKLPVERTSYTGSQAIVSQCKQGGLRGILHLSIRTVHFLQTQATSQFQEETVFEIFRIAQLIPQILRDTLR